MSEINEMSEISALKKTWKITVFIMNTVIIYQTAVNLNIQKNDLLKTLQINEEIEIKDSRKKK